jgi:hypothetical protein
MCLSSVRLDVEHENKQIIKKRQVFKRIGLHAQSLLSILSSTIHTVGELCNQLRRKRVLITMMNEIFIWPPNIRKKCVQLQCGYATLNMIFDVTYYLKLWNTKSTYYISRILQTNFKLVD